MATKEPIAAVGAGRMGRGIAVAFAFSGHPVRLIDAKPRSPADAEALKTQAMQEVADTLSLMAGLGLLSTPEAEAASARVTFFSRDEMAEGLDGVKVIFEGVPETLEAKREGFAAICEHADGQAIIASTTSTILSNDLAGLVTHPERFLNAHWLNPAFLVPLVELSPCAQTSPETTEGLKALLERIGKVPVLCAASPGYIVPRIQALAMNEAARLAEEGVASAEDIDKATKYGLGFRFAVLGMLEFIDWGGGDILYHASRYMQSATGSDRFAAPDIIESNMAQGRTGLRDGQGFLDYEGLDLPAYRQERLQAFADMLRHLGKLPVKGQ